MKKILIVEDDQLVATAYRKRFGEAGYHVDWAPDGLEGIKMVAASKPDVVLLDLLMPRLDGIEVLKYIRTHPELKNLPVVVFSNSYMTNLVESAWRNGADQCLMKASTTPAQLFDAVNKAMEKAAARAKGHVQGATGTVPAINPLNPAPAKLAPALPVNPQAAAAASLRPAANYVAPVTPLSQRPAASAPGARPTPAPALAAAATFSPAATGGEPAAVATPSLQVDPEFQAQIRQLFLNSAPAKLTSVREAANAFVQDEGSSMQFPLLVDLFRKVHSLTGNAAVAGCRTIAHFASTFEAYLQELQQKPKYINASSTRTVVRSVDLIEALFGAPADDAVVALKPLPVLVVTAEPMAGQAIAMALEKAEIGSCVANDPAHALELAAEGNFSSVVMSSQLQGLTGFELCAQMQSQSGFGRTPVVFVSDLKDFEAHSQSELLGENDIIASPYLLIELTLKVLGYAEMSRAQKQQAAA